MPAGPAMSDRPLGKSVTSNSRLSTEHIDFKSELCRLAEQSFISDNCMTRLFNRDAARVVCNGPAVTTTEEQCAFAGIDASPERSRRRSRERRSALA
jgi:hypothetical protein